MSNVKAGDLAVIVRSSQPEAIGHLVNVLSRAPSHEFILPCGAWTDSGPDSWVVRFLAPLQITSKLGLPILVDEGACRDAHLRPIRPQADDADCESKAWLPPVPTKEHA